MPDQISTLRNFLAAARHIAVLTGAGISTESGIPDFRSPGGLYRTVTSEEVFDIVLFDRHPDRFYQTFGPIYRAILDARPNEGHLALAELERSVREVTIATQNIDNLHQKAGSRTVYELHGSLRTLTCRQCGRMRQVKGNTEIKENKEIKGNNRGSGNNGKEPADDLADLLAAGQVPRCPCGGVFKPDIVFFGEALPEFALGASVFAFESADLILALGTSLAVYPAAELPNRRAGSAKFVIINAEPTSLDHDADLVIRAPLGVTLREAITRLR